MKVFIENEAGNNYKNLFNEKKLEFKESIPVSRPYPFPYGFILDTSNEDGDNLDVFVLTNKKLKSGQIVECKPIGLMEQFEIPWDTTENQDEEQDHNILAVLSDEEDLEISKDTKVILTNFVLHVFDSIRPNKTRVGQFHNKSIAIDFIEQCKD